MHYPISKNICRTQLDSIDPCQTNYTIVRPLLILSKCSFALVRNVAMELVRISELCIVMFNALSLDNKFGSPLPSVSVPLIGGGFSTPIAVVALGGDVDEADDDTKRIPADDKRIPCDGDIERFCGEPIGGKLVTDDGNDAGGKWFGGVWRCNCAVIWPFGWCGGDRRIFWLIACGEIRRFGGPPWWARPKLVIAKFEGLRLSGGVK